MATTIALAHAEPAGAPQHPPRARSTGDIRTLDLSRSLYWVLSLAIVVLYLVVWVSHFQYVYGVMSDDYFVWFLKGLHTTENWQRAFTDFPNELQLYFFLVSYLPLKLGLSLPSYPLPIPAEHVGPYRFLMLYVVVLHAGLLLVWAWVAPRLVQRRLVALLSLLLLVSSPSFIFWSPVLDSRYLGLPFILIGLALLLRVVVARPGAAAAPAGTLFLAGSAFGLAQGIHYTALYLVAPLCVVFGALYLTRRQPRRTTWVALLAFVAGICWLQALFELMSHLILGVGWDQGPIRTLLEVWTIHASPWDFTGNLALWAEWFTSQMGPVLLLAIVGGWLLYTWPARRPGEGAPLQQGIVGLGVALGLLYLAVAGAMPLFRQTVPMQPFLFLFASVAIVALAERLVRSVPLRALVLGALTVAVGAVQWGQAMQVFEAHQSLGRVLALAYTQQGDRPVAWLPIATQLTNWSEVGSNEIKTLPANTWLLSYFPWGILGDETTLRSALELTPPVAAWPTLHATDAGRAEIAAYGHHDMREDDLLGTARIVEVGSLQAAMAGPPLRVETVLADSTADPSVEPLNVFDHGSAPDGSPGWLSANTTAPHWLEARFAAPVTLGAASIVTWTNDFRNLTGYTYGTRILDLQIEALDTAGDYSTVWSGSDLEDDAAILAQWTPRPVAGLRFVVRRQAALEGETPQAAIKEILFPGYQVVGPRPTRALPPLALGRLDITGDELRVTGTGFTRHTTLVVDGQPVATRFLDSGQLVMRLTDRLRSPTPPVAIAAMDQFRQAGAVPWPPSVPSLRTLEPTATRRGVLFNLQADGSSSTLRLECSDATADTQVLWDDAPLVILGAPSCPFTALVRPEALAVPGSHTVTLRNYVGVSNEATFVVEPE